MTKQKAFPFQPNVGKVLVKQEEALKITSGGIEIPDQARQRPMEGLIVAIHYSPEDNAYFFKEKDHILFGKYDGIEVRIDEEEYLLLDQDQILGKRV
jgi:chaperonin GroES